jgi:hypothetical protein
LLRSERQVARRWREAQEQGEKCHEDTHCNGTCLSGGHARQQPMLRQGKEERPCWPHLLLVTPVRRECRHNSFFRFNKNIVANVGLKSNLQSLNAPLRRSFKLAALGMN